MNPERTETRHDASLRRVALRTLLLAVLVAALAAVVGAHASSAAIVSNGVVKLGIDSSGQLNVPGPVPACPHMNSGVVGLRFVVSDCEATADGCLCEGWGVSYDGSVSGRADNAASPAVAGITPGGFASTATTAVATSQVGDLKVEQDYHPSSATPNLYEDTVTITNTGAVAHSNVRYMRTMDWDIDPTPFSEFVTLHAGSPPPSALIESNDNGFAVPDPLTGCGGVILTIGPPGGPDVTDSGPADHGACFVFDFGSLAPGATKTFNVYYGAADSEASANAAVGAVGASIWSYGQCNGARNPSCNPTTGTPHTFIFAFGGALLTPPPGTPCVMTGRAYLAHLRVEDIGGTGLVGPTDVWSEDTGDVMTAAREHRWAGLANKTGPLVNGDFVGSAVDTYPADCHSEARSGAVHLDGSYNLPTQLAPLHVRVAEAWSRSSCYDAPQGDVTIAYLMVGGVELINTNGTIPPNTQFTVGTITVTVNEQVYTPLSYGYIFEVNAVHISAPGAADLKLLSARSDIHNCPGTPPPPPPPPPKDCTSQGVGVIDVRCIVCLPGLPTPVVLPSVIDGSALPRLPTSPGTTCLPCGPLDSLSTVVVPVRCPTCLDADPTTLFVETGSHVIMPTSGTETETLTIDCIPCTITESAAWTASVPRSTQTVSVSCLCDLAIANDADGSVPADKIDVASNCICPVRFAGIVAATDPPTVNFATAFDRCIPCDASTIADCDICDIVNPILAVVLPGRSCAIATPTHLPEIPPSTGSTAPPAVAPETPPGLALVHALPWSGVRSALPWLPVFAA